MRVYIVASLPFSFTRIRSLRLSFTYKKIFLRSSPHPSRRLSHFRSYCLINEEGRDRGVVGDFRGARGGNSAEDNEERDQAPGKILPG